MIDQHSQDVVAMWKRLHDNGYFIKHPYYGGGEMLQCAGFATSLSLALGQLLSTDDVLEIGCGYGRLMHSLAGSVGTITGVDLHANPIKVAKRLLGEFDNVAVFVNDGLTLPFDDDSFDVVYSFSVMQHVSKEIVRGYFIEVGRVLRDGGRFLMQFSKPATSKEIVVRYNCEQSVKWTADELQTLAAIVPGSVVVDTSKLFAVVKLL